MQVTNRVFIMKINAEKMTENTIFLDSDLQSIMYASGS